MAVQQIPHNILIIRPSALGDVCRTVGVLASLRRAFPDARIDWVVQDDFTPAIANHPALNKAIAFPRARFARWWKSPTDFMALMRWLTDLRRNRYDLVLDCQGLARSGFITRITSARRRVGLRSARELAWLGYNLRTPLDQSQSLPVHTVDQMFLLVEALGIEVVRDMRLYVGDEDRQWWQQKRTHLGMGAEPYAVIAPTSRWLSKRWPIERFAQLIEPLLQRGFGHVVVIGAPSERDQVQNLVQASQGYPIIDLVGHAKIGQTMAVIADAGMVIANDSAPLHFSVGFARPAVGLFGPTEPSEVGPYQRQSSVVRGYHPSAGERINFKDKKLGDSLMRFISTVSVIQAIDRELTNAARIDAQPHAAELRA